MKLRIFFIIAVIIIIVASAIFSFYRNKNNQRANIKIPVLLYHNFVQTVPEEDTDDFNYINTPQSMVMVEMQKAKEKTKMVTI